MKAPRVNSLRPFRTSETDAEHRHARRRERNEGRQVGRVRSDKSLTSTIVTTKSPSLSKCSGSRRLGRSEAK